MTTNEDDDLTVEAILATLEAAHVAEEPVVEGLRDRKKRRLRQRISNVATALFLAEGFDAVSVARIAAACDVSEQTVFNYFPTKESMFFDRDESHAEALAEAVRSRRAEPLDEVVVNAIVDGIPLDRWQDLDEATRAAPVSALLRGGRELAGASGGAVRRTRALHGDDRRSACRTHRLGSR